MSLVRRSFAPAVAVASLALLGPTTVFAYEEPPFQVIAAYDAFEVRRYEPFLVAEIRVDGEFKEAGNEAFPTLFAYISGANAVAEKIEMTTPVTQLPNPGSEPSSDSYAVSFVLPSRFGVDTAPEPADREVRIRQIPERTMAVIRYSGLWSEKRYREHESKLLAAIETAGYEPLGAPEWARYNAPFTPWFLRRNEVLVEVRKRPRQHPAALG